MNKTGIIWTEVSWNPISGCKSVSTGCRYCYARTLAENKRGTLAFPNGFDLTVRPHKLKEPLRLKEPTMVFVNSMSDMFLEDIPDCYRDEILDVIEQTPQHQYQVLTKRPDNMLRYSKRRQFPGNFWAGVTVENQRCASRIDILREVASEIRFVSAEPLLGLLDLDLSGIHWMITGGESGVHLYDESVREQRGLVDYVDRKWIPRPSRIAWVLAIRDLCLEQKVKFFHKQWGGVRPKSAGRELEGRTWEEFPRLPEEGKVNPMLFKDMNDSKANSAGEQK